MRDGMVLRPCQQRTDSGRLQTMQELCFQQPHRVVPKIDEGTVANNEGLGAVKWEGAVWFVALSDKGCCVTVRR